MIDVVKNSECGPGCDHTGGDERYRYPGLESADHDVQRNQECDNGPSQQDHPVSKGVTKRDNRFLLFDSQAPHAAIIGGNSASDA